MPNLPNVPGFSAFGYSTADASKMPTQPDSEKKKCEPCTSVPEVLVLDKKDFPKPKVQISTSVAA